MFALRVYRLRYRPNGTWIVLLLSEKRPRERDDFRLARSGNRGRGAPA
jgi:hypothetical protein